MAKLKTGNRLIMIADDDDDLAFLIASQLSQAGFKVHKCMGGINLVNDVLQYKPSLLLLDISMQQLDGTTLCREIKNDPRIAQLPILLMSGNHNVASLADSCGANGFIAKPLSLDTLKAVIAKYI